MRAPWLADVLLAGGLAVKELPGWKGRGGEMAGIRGVVCHHTAIGPNLPDESVARILRDGRPDLKGPLSQLGLDRQGRFWVVADGRANHNGYGEWGNDSLGIEAFNDGVGEAWPQVQVDAWQRGCGALVRHLGLDAAQIKGHKETDPKRKIDPHGVDMGLFRTMVRRHLWATEDDMTPEEKAQLAEALQHAKAAKEIAERIEGLLTKPLAPLVAKDGNDKQASPRWAWYRALGL